MNMFKENKYDSPEEYIAAIEDKSRRQDVHALHQLILGTVPELKPYMISGMIGYGTFHYKSSSGREGDWFIVGLASNKNYISLHVCASDGTQYLPESYKDRLPKTDIGKSCVRLKRVADVDVKILEELIRRGAEMMQKTD